MLGKPAGYDKLNNFLEAVLHSHHSTIISHIGWCFGPTWVAPTGPYEVQEGNGSPFVSNLDDTIYPGWPA